MQLHWNSHIVRAATECILGGGALALLTFVCFEFGASVATVGFVYLMFLALLSLTVHMTATYVSA